jgi:osmotically-inducible protein OsmY
MMKDKSLLPLTGLLAAILSVGLSARALAQPDENGTQNSAPASTNEAGDSGGSTGQGGSDTTSELKHLYHRTTAVLRDTKITTEVKIALHQDAATSQSDIHVSTTSGVVTLQGAVPSSDVAKRAEQIARATEGVAQVKDDLNVSGASASD